MLDENKAFGCDDIHPKILKQCSLSLLDTIHRLFVSYLTKCSIPNEWKRHKITPILKKGIALEVTNYRPISLLCITSNVLEAIIFRKIIDFIRPRISSHQFGFMKNRSCLMQLLSAFSTIHQAIDNKQ